MYKIFVVEDDDVIAKAVCDNLIKWGYDAKAALDFRNVTAEFTAFRPHLVLLDISLPFFNGYHWCTEIRKISDTPVIFISSTADNINIVMAVNMGGDDFIAKPFDLNVLLAKVQAMLRRTYDFSKTTNITEACGAILNTDDATLYNGDIKIDLTKNEYRILQVLMENKGKVISRDTLMTRLWETDSFVDDNTLTVNITRLRRKLEQNGLPEFIKTKKGLGYLVD